MCVRVMDGVVMGYTIDPSYTGTIHLSSDKNEKKKKIASEGTNIGHQE